MHRILTLAKEAIILVAGIQAAIGLADFAKEVTTAVVDKIKK